MIAGLHWTAWLLLFLAVVPGLLLVLRYRSVHADVLDGGAPARPAPDDTAPPAQDARPVTSENVSRR